MTALIKSAFGGVLLVDEVTSLSDGRSASSGDAFSKMAIDILNRMLTEDGHRFICIVAGYADEIDRDFYSMNQGLRRRFTTTWSIDGYTASEMLEMTLRLFVAKGMVLETCVLTANMFVERLKHSDVPVMIDGYVSKGALFSENAGSVELFVDNVLRCHASRVFGETVKNIIIQADIDTGLMRMREKSFNTTRSIPTSSTMYI